MMCGCVGEKQDKAEINLLLSVFFTFTPANSDIKSTAQPHIYTFAHQIRILVLKVYLCQNFYKSKQAKFFA